MSGVGSGGATGAGGGGGGAAGESGAACPGEGLSTFFPVAPPLVVVFATRAGAAGAGAEDTASAGVIKGAPVPEADAALGPREGCSAVREAPPVDGELAGGCEPAPRTANAPIPVTMTTPATAIAASGVRDLGTPATELTGATFASVFPQLLAVRVGGDGAPPDTAVGTIARADTCSEGSFDVGRRLIGSTACDASSVLEPRSTPSMRSTDTRAACVPKGPRAVARWATDGYRHVGSFSRQRSTMASSSAGSEGDRERSGGGRSVTIAAITPARESATNGSVPVRSWCRITPSAQTSARASTSFALRSCSGDMNDGEPITVSVRVSCVS